MLVYDENLTTTSTSILTLLNESYRLSDSYSQLPTNENARLLVGIYILVLILTIATNGFFISLMIYRRKSWTAHDILILNISISDAYYVISFSWVLLPVALPGIHRPVFSTNSFFCRLLMVSCAFSFYVNLYLLAASAVASYLKIVQSKLEITRKLAWYIVCCIYLVSALSLSPPLIGYFGKLTYYPNLGICLFDFGPEIRLNQILYAFCIMYPTFFINTNIIAYCYYRIYRVVRQSSKAVAQYDSSVPHNRRNMLGEDKSTIATGTSISRHVKFRPSDISLAKTLLTVFSLFMISYSPFAISNLLHFTRAAKTTITVDLYLLLLSCSNSVFNPIIFYSKRRHRRVHQNWIVKKPHLDFQTTPSNIQMDSNTVHLNNITH
ncbi:Rhodopsin, GQ-coupled [Trichoplax sp. H2]|nr:Rhodopsin, GQ-coupled [Trichoplax sp. H2]|eukprot:RDD42467.1 Rhodopsin, GQ-coupled [Trichoplax sp. H2]